VLRKKTKPQNNSGTKRNLLLSVMAVSLVCTANLGVLGPQVVMVVMAATEPKVTGVVLGRLDPKGHQEPLERMAPEENLESRALPAKRGSVERVEQVESLGLLMGCFIRIGKSVHGIN